MRHNGKVIKKGSCGSSTAIIIMSKLGITNNDFIWKGGTCILYLLLLTHASTSRMMVAKLMSKSRSANRQQGCVPLYVWATCVLPLMAVWACAMDSLRASSS
eukprot:10021609-Karenia_brevis.AAC.1